MYTICLQIFLVVSKTTNFGKNVKIIGPLFGGSTSSSQASDDRMPAEIEELLAVAGRDKGGFVAMGSTGGRDHMLEAVKYIV